MTGGVGTADVTEPGNVVPVSESNGTGVRTFGGLPRRWDIFG